MSDFENRDSKRGFSVKLWRGERMCLLGFDVLAPEDDLVGFAIEVKAPGAADFAQLPNRLAFSYDKPATAAVDGARKFPSKEAPFQKFRWIDFPFEPKKGTYTYRATKMHMPRDGVLKAGTQLELGVSLDPVTYDGFVDVGFTRNFASSQAFRERYKQFMPKPKIIPATADAGLEFAKVADSDVYDWLGFEAYDLVFDFLDRALADPSIELDVFAYDLNERDIVDRLTRLGPRLRAIVDDSTSKDKKGKVTGHGTAESAESRASEMLAASAGQDRVKRLHFQGLQHHKVFIARRNGQPFEVLCGSTNFTFRGLYIQANNALVFRSPEVAGLFGRVFEAAFRDAKGFKNDPTAAKWHVVSLPGRPEVHLCFSPHGGAGLSLTPVAAAVEQATSSVLYSVAFLNQIKSGATKQAFDRLMTKPVFSYGISDEAGQLEVKKPDGSRGLVDFAFLGRNAPEPFKSEWEGGKGINIHHKFVVADFSLPSAKVFTGSSNLSPSGETGNGDHLMMIADRKIAIAYAIEAVRIFDHLHFRVHMSEAAEAGKKAGAKPKAGTPAAPASDKLTLRKPRAISGKPAWFERYYVAGSQIEKDRKVFSE